jgi:endonuclease YncB( thermonuclease family)
MFIFSPLCFKTQGRGALFGISPSYAQDFVMPDMPDTSAMAMTGTGQIDIVIDPLRVRLVDGRVIQFSTLEIPDLSANDGGPLAENALEALRPLLEKKSVSIYQTKKKDKGRTNRMGHHMAHLIVRAPDKSETLWVQGYMIANGLARVLPSRDNTDLFEAMLKAETKARTDKTGLWSDEIYQVLSPQTAVAALYSWGIIEGKIHSSALVRNMLYLNFGDNWRDDFTIAVPSSVRRAMMKEGLNPQILANKTVRVRGWVQAYNGPYIELNHPAWLEILP